MVVPRVEPPPSLAFPPSWPTAVVDTTLARAAALRDAVDPTGPVLELWRPESRRLVRDAAFLATGLARTGEPGESVAPTVVPQPATYATIVSVGDLVHLADLPLALSGISYLLAPGGRAVLVEPIGVPGLVAFLRASIASGPRRGRPAGPRVHLARDVPAALRAAGFTLGSIERFSVPDAAAPLRTWMAAVAVHIDEQPDPTSGDGIAEAGRAAGEGSR